MMWALTNGSEGTRGEGLKGSRGKRDRRGWRSNLRQVFSPLQSRGAPCEREPSFSLHEGGSRWRSSTSGPPSRRDGSRDPSPRVCVLMSREEKRPNSHCLLVRCCPLKQWRAPKPTDWRRAGGANRAQAVGQRRIMRGGGQLGFGVCGRSGCCGRG